MGPTSGRRLMLRAVKQTSLDDPMLSFPVIPKLCRRLLPAAALAVSLATASGGGAFAQVAAMVNGEPITELDIAQRTKLTQLSGQKPPTRQETLEELIEEKLKLHVAK